MHINFFDFLPYSIRHKLKGLNSKYRLLILLDYLCKISKMTIKSYFYKEYHFFDPQVGENLCQIHAYQLCTIFDESMEIAKEVALFSIRLNEIHAKCEHLLEEIKELKIRRPSHYMQDIDGRITLLDYLEKNQLNLHLTERVAFLIQSYFLTKYRIIDEQGICNGIDYDVLCNEIYITSKTFIKKLVRHIQINITDLTTKFLSTLLVNIDCEPERVFLMQSLHFKDEDGRHVFGCYEATKLILEHAFITGKHIEIAVKRNSENASDELIFSLIPDKNTGRFTTANPIIEQSHKPSIVFRGVAKYSEYINETRENYIQRFLSVGFENILLSNVAQHPQYPGTNLDKLKYNPYRAVNTNQLTVAYQNYVSNAEKEFLKHKHMAVEFGCMQESSNLFLLIHVRSINSQQSNENLKEHVAL